jgi:hypothetical protein
MTRTRACRQEIRRSRLRKSGQFLDAADLVRDLAEEDGEIADAYVTLRVHAGIAAADVICCARLGEQAQGEDHNEAITLLGRADRDSAKHLRTLLTMNMKTKAGYSHVPANADECKRAGGAAETLVETARRIQAAGPR